MVKARFGVRIAETIAQESGVGADFGSASCECRCSEICSIDGHNRRTNNALVLLAARSERALELAKAEEDADKAELAMALVSGEKKQEENKKWENAKKAVEEALKKLDSPGNQYSSLVGAEKSLESNIETEESRRKPFPTTSTGRRSALARWMIHRDHPLTARVAVNHMWARLFGKPLVSTVFDFGLHGAPPVNQQLLDWLAIELMENNWSMKHLHRLMVTSRLYRTTSSMKGADAKTLELDPDNRFYWRMNSTRMESEVIRDSLLCLSNQLDLTMGGPSISINDEKTKRRSLYFVHSHNEHHRLLSMFDDANVLDCYRRAESVVPQQALALANSKLSLEMSEILADQIWLDSGQDPPMKIFVKDAFLRVLGYVPNDNELNAVIEAMVKLEAVADAKDTNQAGKRARTGVVHALLNHNDFLTIR